MGFLSKVLRFVAENFVFLVGFLFIFVIGFLYALIKPQGFLFNIVFLLITVVWIIFMVRYFWELMEKNESGKK